MHKGMDKSLVIGEKAAIELKFCMRFIFTTSSAKVRFSLATRAASTYMKFRVLFAYMYIALELFCYVCVSEEYHDLRSIEVDKTI